MGLEGVASGVMIKEVLLKLDVETLCSLACVSRSLRFSVSQALSLFSALNLSVCLSLSLPLFSQISNDGIYNHCLFVWHWQTFSPDAQTVAHILGRTRTNGGGLLKSLTINCLRLNDSCVPLFLSPHLHDLNLLSCSLLSYHLLPSIGETCPNLR